jgi:hypothetical protein
VFDCSDLRQYERSTVVITAHGRQYCENSRNGGGWTLIMKIGGRNTDTFRYESPHWSMATTLNEEDLSTRNADAKYPAFNTHNFTEWLAVWPEFRNGTDAWTIGPFNATTSLELFQSSRMFSSAIVNMSGFNANYFSTQPGVQVYGINQTTTGLGGVTGVRWGYSWSLLHSPSNTPGVSVLSNQVFSGAGGGIGLRRHPYSLQSAVRNVPQLSAGDWFACPGGQHLHCGKQALSPGLNRGAGQISYPVNIFGRNAKVSQTPMWLKVNVKQAISFSFDRYRKYNATGTMFVRACFGYADVTGAEDVLIRLRHTDSAGGAVLFEDILPPTAVGNITTVAGSTRQHGLNHACGLWHEVEAISCAAASNMSCQLDILHQPAAEIVIYECTLEVAVIGATHALRDFPVGQVNIPVSYKEAAASGWTRVNKGRGFAVKLSNYHQYVNAPFVAFPNNVSFAGAEQLCIEYGGHLASVHNDAELYALGEAIRQAGVSDRHVFIGAQKNHRASAWQFLDGSTYDATFMASRNFLAFGDADIMSVIRYSSWNGMIVGSPLNSRHTLQLPFACSRTDPTGRLQARACVSFIGNTTSATGAFRVRLSRADPTSNLVFIEDTFSLGNESSSRARVVRQECGGWRAASTIDCGHSWGTACAVDIQPLSGDTKVNLFEYRLELDVADADFHSNMHYSGRLHVPCLGFVQYRGGWLPIDARGGFTFSLPSYSYYGTMDMRDQTIRFCVTYTDDTGQRDSGDISLRLVHSSATGGGVFLQTTIGPATRSNGEILRSACGGWSAVANVSCGVGVGDTCSLQLHHSTPLANGTVRNINLYSVEIETGVCFAGFELLNGKCAPKQCTMGIRLNRSNTVCLGATGDGCIYDCDEGFHYSHPHICMFDGVFRGGECMINRCFNVTVNHSSTECYGTYNDDCVPNCDQGYHADSPMRCKSFRRFVGPGCSPSACTEGISMPNSPTQCRGNTTDMCDFVCYPGYTKRGTRVCLPNGTFAGGHCDINPCTSGLVPRCLADSRYTASQCSLTRCRGFTGGECAYTCMPGWMPNGRHVCLTSGSFQGGQCVLVNPCAANLHDCHVAADCTSTMGGHHDCTCKVDRRTWTVRNGTAVPARHTAGFFGTGRQCQPWTHCREFAGCRDQSGNTVDFNDTCTRTGFTYTPASCVTPTSTIVETGENQPNVSFRLHCEFVQMAGVGGVTASGNTYIPRSCSNASLLTLRTCEQTGNIFLAANATHDSSCISGFGRRINAQLACEQRGYVWNEASFEIQLPTNVSDRVCAAVSTCPAGTKQTRAPSFSSNRRCSPCPTGTYQPVAGGRTSCPACAPGKTDYDNDATTSCQICVPGTYQPNFGQVGTCTLHSSQFACTFNTYDHDSNALTACIPCQDGYHSDLRETQCHAIECSYDLAWGGSGPASSSPQHSSSVCIGYTGDVCTFQCDPGYASSAANHSCRSYQEINPGSLSTVGDPNLYHGRFSGGACVPSMCVGDDPLVGCTPGIPSSCQAGRGSSTWTALSAGRGTCAGHGSGTNFRLGLSSFTAPHGGSTGSICPFRCDLGWKEKGVRSCPASRWRHYRGGGCEALPCRRFHPNNSITVCEGFTEDVCSVECKAGYAGSWHTYTCNASEYRYVPGSRNVFANGTFVKEDPSAEGCVPAGCAVIAPPTYAGYLGSCPNQTTLLPHGESCRFVCKEGFYLNWGDVSQSQNLTCMFGSIVGSEVLDGEAHCKRRPEELEFYYHPYFFVPALGMSFICCLCFFGVLGTKWKAKKATQKRAESIFGFMENPDIEALGPSDSKTIEEWLFREVGINPKVVSNVVEELNKDDLVVTLDIVRADISDEDLVEYGVKKSSDRAKILKAIDDLALRVTKGSIQQQMQEIAQGNRPAPRVDSMEVSVEMFLLDMVQLKPQVVAPLVERMKLEDLIMAVDLGKADIDNDDLIDYGVKNRSDRKKILEGIEMMSARTKRETVSAQMKALAGESETFTNPLGHKTYGTMNTIVLDVRGMFKEHTGAVALRTKLKTFASSSDAMRRDDFKRFLKSLDIGLSTAHVDHLIAYFDRERDGFIDPEEFLKRFGDELDAERQQDELERQKTEAAAAEQARKAHQEANVAEMHAVADQKVREERERERRERKDRVKAERRAALKLAKLKIFIDSSSAEDESKSKLLEIVQTREELRNLPREQILAAGFLGEQKRLILQLQQRAQLHFKKKEALARHGSTVKIHSSSESEQSSEDSEAETELHANPIDMTIPGRWEHGSHVKDPSALPTSDYRRSRQDIVYFLSTNGVDNPDTRAAEVLKSFVNFKVPPEQWMEVLEEMRKQLILHADPAPLLRRMSNTGQIKKEGQDVYLFLADRGLQSHTSRAIGALTSAGVEPNVWIMVLAEVDKQHQPGGSQLLTFLDDPVAFMSEMQNSAMQPEPEVVGAVEHFDSESDSDGEFHVQSGLKASVGSSVDDKQRGLPKQLSQNHPQRAEPAEPLVLSDSATSESEDGDQTYSAEVSATEPAQDNTTATSEEIEARRLAHVKQADAAMKTQDFSKAITECEQGLLLGPHSEETAGVRMLKAAIRKAKQKKEDSAMASAKSMRSQGEQAMGTFDFASAVSLFEQALASGFDADSRQGVLLYEVLKEKLQEAQMAHDAHSEATNCLLLATKEMGERSWSSALFHYQQGLAALEPNMAAKSDYELEDKLSQGLAAATNNNNRVIAEAHAKAEADHESAQATRRVAQQLSEKEQLLQQRDQAAESILMDRARSRLTQLQARKQERASKAPAVLVERYLHDMRPKELRSLLQQRGLEHRGLKTDLIQRLVPVLSLDHEMVARLREQDEQYIAGLEAEDTAKRSEQQAALIERLPSLSDASRDTLLSQVGGLDDLVYMTYDELRSKLSELPTEEHDDLFSVHAQLREQFAAEVTAELQAQTESVAVAAAATERRQMAQAVEAETTQAQAADEALELKTDQQLTDGLVHSMRPSEIRRKLEEMVRPRSPCFVFVFFVASSCGQVRSTLDFFADRARACAGPGQARA